MIPAYHSWNESREIGCEQCGGPCIWDDGELQCLQSCPDPEGFEDVSYLAQTPGYSDIEVDAA